MADNTPGGGMRGLCFAIGFIFGMIAVAFAMWCVEHVVIQ